MNREPNRGHPYTGVVRTLLYLCTLRMYRYIFSLTYNCICTMDEYGLCVFLFAFVYKATLGTKLNKLQLNLFAKMQFIEQALVNL